MTIKPYGILGDIEFVIPSKLNRKLIDLIVEYRESLINEQERLWGSK